MRNRSLGLVVAASLVWGVVVLALLADNKGKKATPKSVSALIEDLGSDDFDTRETATRLLAVRDDAEGALRKALASKDKEVVRRARKILTIISTRNLPKALARIQAAAKAGEIDLLAERLALWEGDNKKAECWQTVLDVGWKLKDLGEKKFKRLKGPADLKDRFPPKTYATFAAWGRPVALSPGRPEVTLSRRDGGKLEALFLARGERVLVEHHGNGLMAATEKARFGALSYSIVLSAGSVSVTRLSAGASMVVCDGDFIGNSTITQCVIIARGKVTCSDAKGCVILAGGDVRIGSGGYVEKSTIWSAGTVHLPKAAPTDSEVKNKVANPTKAVSFFQTARVGIEVAADKAGLKITKVDARQPFAKAGLKAGDRLVALDGKKVASADAFRRLLRRHVALADDAAFTVRRGGKTLTVTVRCPE